MGSKVEFPSWPYYDVEQTDAVRRVLESGKVNYWTGNEGSSFESEFASYVGSEFAIALANGTVALELALASLGIGAGDEVIVPCYTFVATASAVVMRGATPVCADVDQGSLTLSAETISAHITDRTKAVIAVHLAGHPCDMDPIIELGKRHQFAVIEDCAQAHGATYKGRQVGSIGDIGAFSFCQDKIMTTGGEGGMLTTSDESVFEFSRAFKDHGKSAAAMQRAHLSAGFSWVHESFGTNWRMTEMQAALGRIQLARLPAWLQARQANAAMLTAGLEEVHGIGTLQPGPEVNHAYYKYYFYVQTEKLAAGWTRDRIMDAIVAAGVPCFSGVCPEIYRELAFKNAGLGPETRLPGASQFGEVSLMLLVHPTLGAEHMDESIRVVSDVMSQATSQAC